MTYCALVAYPGQFPRSSFGGMRTYHELTDADRSGLLQQITAQRQRVAERLASVRRIVAVMRGEGGGGKSFVPANLGRAPAPSSVRRIVAVMSGKGGVGKSFVTANLARALARSGGSVGVLDADLNGPTIPRLLSLPEAPLRHSEGSIAPVTSAEGVRCISMALLL